MKKIIFISLSFAALVSIAAAPAYAQEEETESRKKGIDISLGSDVVSSYIWRGSYNAGASIQPFVALKTGGFSLTAWGSVDFTASDYKEVDLTATYSIAGFTFTVVDYYWTGAPNESVMPDRNYFHFGEGTPHMIEAGVAYCFGEKFPLTVSWNTMLLGHDKDAATGKRNYSTYAEISYPFSVKTVDMNAWVGLTPWETRNMYGTTGFAVCNVGIGASKAIRCSKSFSIPIFTRLIWNPAKEDVNLVGGFTIAL